MRKKLILACMAIAAFAAFVIAPAASASPVLTSEGKSVPVSTSVTGVNTGVTKFTIVKDGAAIECDHDHLVGTVTANTGTKIKAEITVGNAKFNGTGTNTDCTSPSGPTSVTVNSKLCLETSAPPADNVVITGCGANVTFTMNITGIATCKYETASVTGTYTTAPSEATVNISDQPAKPDGMNPFPCPGEGWLDMDFDLYTTGGVGLTIS